MPDLPRGIDVSSHQGQIDWDAVAASGVSFAFTKVTEDDNYTNPTFRRNWLEMRRVGISRGAYHFARPENDVDAREEADYFVDRLESVEELQEGDILALDLESGSGDLGQWALDFLHRVEERVGFKPIIYTGAWFAGPHNLAAYPELGAYGLWLAAYQAERPPAPSPWSFPAFWQYTDKGRVPGIAGDVDLNVFNGDVSRIKLYGAPAPPAPPAPPILTPALVRAQLTEILDENDRLLRTAIGAWMDGLPL